ncbi:hypothetical protein RHGRI_003719 [Rhododendron griersonianum]|uniref:Small acidic protein 1 n=1 Tax=Rhododendron griersonianum TaxID=479676 RepID=A0AAV6L7X8_9ERIC|nr:hypothetical protein RHGRI_003719 [Rhododendron griersonianum]
MLSLTPKTVYCEPTLPTEREKEMKPSPVDYFAEMEDHGSSMAMDVDDNEALEMFGEGPISFDNKIADADFYNSFEDDFDDTDIN